MKRLILSSLFTASLACLSFSQGSIELNPPVISAAFNGVNLSQYQDLEAHMGVTNTSGQEIQLRWIRETPEDCPAAWKTLVCDNNTCYSDFVWSNVDTALSLDVPFVLDSGETFSGFLVHLIPHGEAGCCQVKIHFYETEHPDDLLGTAYFNFSVNTTDCNFPTGTHDPTEVAALHVFPNPTADYFGIGDNRLIQRIDVSNLLGKRVRSFAHQNGNRYDISNLPDGLYLISLRDAQNEILKTIRLAKRSLRP